MAPSVIAMSQLLPVRLSVSVSVFLLIISSFQPFSPRAYERHDGRPLDPHVRAHRQGDRFVVRAAFEHDLGFLGECAIEIDRKPEHTPKHLERRPLMDEELADLGDHGAPRIWRDSRRTTTRPSISSMAL